jgi:hypothetical protein
MLFTMTFQKKFGIIFVLQLIFWSCCSFGMQAANQEMVYLQTDRTVYVSGETVFFKWYVLDAATKKYSDISSIGYMELRSPQSDPVLKIRVPVEKGIASGSIVLPDSLHSGVYQIVAFTGLMRNRDESHYFHQEVLIANRFDKELDFESIKHDSRNKNICCRTDSLLSIKTRKKEYAPREKVVVSMNLGKVASGTNVAVSVYEEPPFPFTNPTVWEAIDSDTPAPTENAAVINYLPETKTKILRGRVVDANTKKRIQNALVFLSRPDTVANLQYATTDSEGQFLMPLSRYYDGKELFFTIKDMPTDQNWKIEIEDNFQLSEKWNPEFCTVKEYSKEYLTKCQDIAYVNATYDQKYRTENQTSHKLICPQVYHCPAKMVYPSEFVALDSFPEIAVEILPSVRVFKQEGKYHARTVSKLQEYYGYNETVLFLDGVYIDDINKIIPLTSERIRKIEVLDNKRAFGDLAFYGIVSIQSTSNEIRTTVPAPQSLRLKNDSNTVGNNFIVINPNSAPFLQTPFFKQLLYWNPTLTLRQNETTDVEFYTSDHTATFTIKAEGISPDGIPVSASARIQVIDSQNATNQ